MNILKKINKNRCIVFGIETILPFMIPFIFEIPEEYIEIGRASCRERV